jgi:hypothetical protein
MQFVAGLGPTTFPKSPIFIIKKKREEAQV